MCKPYFNQWGSVTYVKKWSLKPPSLLMKVLFPWSCGGFFAKAWCCWSLGRGLYPSRGSCFSNVGEKRKCSCIKIVACVGIPRWSEISLELFTKARLYIRHVKPPTNESMNQLFTSSFYLRCKIHSPVTNPLGHCAFIYANSSKMFWKFCDHSRF